MTTNQQAERRTSSREAPLQPLKAPTKAQKVRFSVEERVIDGMDTMVAIFGKSVTTNAHTIALADLNSTPGSRAQLAVAFAATAARRGAITSRRTLFSALRTFVAFLQAQNLNAITPEKIDEDLRLRFVAWLNRSDGGSASLSPRSRMMQYRCVVQVIRTGMQFGMLGSADHPFDLVAEPWKGQHVPEPKQSAYLDPSSMTTILRYCAEAVDQTIREIDPLLDALDSGDLTSTPAQEASRLRDALLAGAAKGVRVLPHEAQGLHPWGEAKQTARRVVLPDQADLMPFAILLAHYTTFNTATLFRMRIDGIESVAMGDAGFVSIRSFKARRGKEDEALFAIDGASTNPDRLIRFVSRWTDTMRRATGSPLLWIAAGNRRYHLLDEDVSGKQPGRHFDLTGWLRRRNLPHATFSSIRKGVRDLAHLVADADRNAIANMGGQSAQTIDRHYVSPDARRRERARVATAADRYERWFSSDGKVDARALPELVDRTAATPGFVCQDNRASPMTGLEGRSCTAYGMCPMCPLASVDTTSPRSCEYLHLLLDRIEKSFDASDSMTAGPVLGTWGPVARKLLDVWLPRFDAEVHAAAAELSLPRLPDVE